MDVSVIIINYNTRQMTSECVDSVIVHTTGLEYEIILVDNASSDGSKEFFKNDPRVKYIYSTLNRGFGVGNNIGAKNACGKYLFLLNSDTLLQNNAIKMLFDFSENQTRPCVCGAWLLDRKGNPNVSEVAFPHMTVAEFIKSRFIKPCRFNSSEIQQVDVVCGADMFMPKELFDNIGGFDESIFMYGEEVEMQYRMSKIGVPRFVIPGPGIIHFGKGSPTCASTNHFRSHFFFLKKHMSTFNYYCARTFYVLYFTIRKIFGASYIKVKDAFIRI